jgi:hypothetical protein
MWRILDGGSRGFTVDRESVEEAVVVGDAPSGSRISTYFVSLGDSNRLTSMTVGRLVRVAAYQHLVPS